MQGRLFPTLFSLEGNGGVLEFQATDLLTVNNLSGLQVQLNEHWLTVSNSDPTLMLTENTVIVFLCIAVIISINTWNDHS